jgi:MvdD pre-ATP grasp domain/RimK-like ATP-grasp domain
MILILSTREDAHAEIVARKLENQAARYLWFDPADFPAKARITVSIAPDRRVDYVLESGGTAIDLRDVRAIWHRRPGVPEADEAITDDRVREWVSHESQELLGGIWATLDCLQMPGLGHHRFAAESKLTQLVEASRVGFSIPRTFIGNRPECLLEAFSRFGGAAITKVVSNPVVFRDDDEWSAFTRPVQRRDVGYYRSVRYAPLIIQEYIPKAVEIRATVVGERVFAAAIHSQLSHRTRHDWRHYDFDKTPHKVHVLPDRVARLCVQLVRALHLNFGAIDMVLTPSDEYVFLEINPNGQWAWIEDLTGMPISDAIVDLLVEGLSAKERVPETVRAEHEF